MSLRLLLAVSLTGLAACSSGSGDPAGRPPVVTTGPATPDAQGRITGLLDPDAVSGGSASTGATRSGYAYLTETKGTAILARAGLVNPQAIANRPTTGIARFDAPFEIAEVADTRRSYEITQATGMLPVTVDFGRLTVAGRGDGLTVAGRIGARSAGYTGTATWNGMTGDLTGRVNGDSIIGAFTGSGPTGAFSGGFGADAP